MTTTPRHRPALIALYAGLALTVLATAVPFIDHATANVLAAHIRAGYPTYTPARITTAATTYLTILSVVGALGVACWLWTIRAVRRGSRRARGLALTLFALGTTTALSAALIRDTSGDTGLPPLLGWVWLLPCLAGAVAVGLLRRRG